MKTENKLHLLNLLIEAEILLKKGRYTLAKEDIKKAIVLAKEYAENAVRNEEKV